MIETLPRSLEPQEKEKLEQFLLEEIKAGRMPKDARVEMDNGRIVISSKSEFRVDPSKFTDREKNLPDEELTHTSS